MAVVLWSIMDRYTGDEPYEWNPEDPAQVEEARRKFYEFKNKGYAMFRTNVHTLKPEQIKEFDANDANLLFHTKEVVAVPPIAGG